MRRKTRLVVLFTALAGVGAWAALGGKDAQQRSPEVAAAAPKAPPAAVAVAAPAPEEASAMPDRPSLEQMGADPFNVEAPQPAPAAAPLPAPVHSAPPPPPMPYRFAGRLQIGDAMEVYLAKGDDLITVKKGDKLDGQYRVEKIGRTEMTLVHLASGTREKLEYAPPIKEDDEAAETPERTAARPETRARAAAQARNYGALRETVPGS
jgi:hypothetical protein